MSKKKKKNKKNTSRKKSTPQNTPQPSPEEVLASEEEAVTTPTNTVEESPAGSDSAQPAAKGSAQTEEQKPSSTSPETSDKKEKSDAVFPGWEVLFSSALPSSAPIRFRQWWSQKSLTGDGHGDLWTQLLVVAIGALILVPNLNFGLWDCWEPHYAETSRMMLIRKDWVHPYWSYAYLLSKPILMFWYMAASMSIFGVHEWAIRLPFTLHALFLLWTVYFVTSRLFTRRAGLLAAVAMGTAPLFVFLGRQAIVDIIVVSYLTAGLGFFALAVFGTKQERERAKKAGTLPALHLPYLMVFYALMGLALLAKGLMGVAVAGVTVVGYMLLTFDLHLLTRIRLGLGIAVAAIIALPWYIHMSFFPGRNIDDGYTFFKRFVINDNFRRVFGGVHGDKGHSAYFVRQLAYAMGMWVGFLPVALVSFARFRRDNLDLDERLQRFLFSWWTFTFLLFSFSSTKFHHYIFPVIPISGILIGVWADRFLRHEGRPQYRYALLMVVAVFALAFQDLVRNPHHLVNLFVYKYSRPFPWNDVPVFLGLEWNWRSPWFASYFKATPQVMLRFFMSVVAALFVGGYLFNLRKYVTHGLIIVSICFAGYLSQSFMLDLTRHWSQKPLFDAVKKDSALWRNKLLKNKLRDARKYPIPKEALIAFRMRWRGEKFYSLNHDLQLLGTDSYMRTFATIERYRRKGRPMYFLIEKNRLKRLKRAVGTQDSKRLVKLRSVYNKYDLMRVLQSKPWFHSLKKMLRIRENCKSKHMRSVLVNGRKRYYCSTQGYQPHNKYMMLKLKPRPANFKLDTYQKGRDDRNRKYYDDYARNWRKKQRAKRRKKRRKR